MTHSLGDQSIFAGDLIKRSYRKRIVDEFNAGHEYTFDAGDGHVEVIVGAERNLAYRAPLWRLGVDVVEAGKAGWIFQLAERRYAVPPRGTGGGVLYPGRQWQLPRGQRNQSGGEQRSAVHGGLQLQS